MTAQAEHIAAAAVQMMTRHVVQMISVLPDVLAQADDDAEPVRVPRPRGGAE